MQLAIPEHSVLLLDDFQYPRSDRRRCNHKDQTPVHVVGILSVSSVGSEAMQRDVAGLLGWLQGQLSVSSVGSEAMQPHGLCGEYGLLAGPFSILGRIGGDATQQHGSQSWPGPGLSVSSVGSEAMQLLFTIFLHGVS